MLTPHLVKVGLFYYLLYPIFVLPNFCQLHPYSYCVKAVNIYISPTVS